MKSNLTKLLQRPGYRYIAVGCSAYLLEILIIVVSQHLGASFLMYYGLFMLLAPFALKVLHSKFWPIIPVVSISLFILSTWQPVIHSAYLYFFIWQIYFFLGITLGRFRLDILNFYNHLSANISKSFRYGLLSITGATLAISAVTSFRTPEAIHQLPGFNWLYIHQAQFNYLFHNNRAGLLRPLVTFMVFGAAYLLYRKHRTFLLQRTGNFVSTIGRNTLIVFVAQAIAIPLVSAAIPHGSVVINTSCTLALIGLMWLVVKRASLVDKIKSSFYNLIADARQLHQKIPVFTEPEA